MRLHSGRFAEPKIPNLDIEAANQDILAAGGVSLSTYLLLSNDSTLTDLDKLEEINGVDFDDNTIKYNRKRRREESSDKEVN